MTDTAERKPRRRVKVMEIWYNKDGRQRRQVVFMPKKEFWPWRVVKWLIRWLFWTGKKNPDR